MRPRGRPELFIIAVILAAAMVLMSGAAVTVYAAQLASPGDTLYPVKVNLRQVQSEFSTTISSYKQTLQDAFEVRSKPVESPSQDGVLTAEPPAVPGSNSSEPEHEGEIKFTGIVESMGDHWSVGGKSIMVLPETNIEDQIQVGNTVEVVAVTDQAGNLVAKEIQLAEDNSTGEAGHAEDDQGEDTDQDEAELHGTEKTITGTVDSISAGSWVINGVTISVTQETEIENQFSTGDVVVVEAILLDNGSLVAKQIERYEAKQAENHDSSEIEDNEIEDQENGSQTSEEVENEQDNESEDAGEVEIEHDDEDTGANKQGEEHEEDHQDNENGSQESEHD